MMYEGMKNLKIQIADESLPRWAILVKAFGKRFRTLLVLSRSESVQSFWRWTSNASKGSRVRFEVFQDHSRWKRS